MRKKGVKNKVYSAEFKIGVIMDMREHHLSYHETVRKYELGNDKPGGARQMLQRWERIYLEEGAEGLMKERRGRACAALNAFCKELLAQHIKTCVTDDIKNGKQETVDEPVATLQKLMK